ncbi:hypothetical protein TELCIR_06519 [Teladorsagia circumcincta]|uniref:Proteasome activator complex subunit 4 C-terminal domain-containing protein n=1 Tax=Teladorsagia circumcincta TaxID=45464 RepID=A0A2G9UMX3_TELCI|nr:hypothetical protein TELCIR_06519 [Teladorsagia circumcincta]
MQTKTMPSTNIIQYLLRLSGSLKDMDIKYSANTLIHDHMSSLLLVPKFADSFLEAVTKSFYTTYLWRVKVSVLKFIQSLVFSNIYELEKKFRPAKVLRLLYDAIVDHQVEVRIEASRAMFTLILCEYIKVNKGLTKAATTALREFRRTHRENWEKTAKLLGSDLVYKIENAIAPLYYA